MKYKKIKMINGATLYYVKNTINTMTAVNIAFDSGSRCDTIPGLAHFCEHMFFTGTKTQNKEQITKKYFDFIGVNAYTSKRDITFTGEVLTNEFANYIDTVSEMITSSEFKTKEIEKEKKVVLQEISRSKDDYLGMAFDFNKYNLIGADCYKYGTLGSEKTVSSITRKDVLDFVHKYFVSDNMEVFCCSPLSIGKVKNILEKHLVKNLRRNEKFTKLPLYCNYVKNDKFLKLSSKQIGKCYLFVNFTNDFSCDDDDFDVRSQFLLMLINDYTTGFMKKLRIDNSLVYGGHMGTTTNDKGSTITFSTECDKKNVFEVIKKLHEYLNEVFTKGFTEEQLKDQKHKFDYSKKSITPSLKRNQNRLYDLKYYGKIRDRDRRNKLMRKLSLVDMDKTLRQCFDGNRVSVSIYGDMDKVDSVLRKELTNLFSKLG